MSRHATIKSAKAKSTANWDQLSIENPAMLYSEDNQHQDDTDYEVALR
jgi:hypothetical protein